MIKQIVEVVTDYEKYNRLCDHLRNYNDGSRVLIFVETKKGCDQLTRSLQVQRLPPPSIWHVTWSACAPSFLLHQLFLNPFYNLITPTLFRVRDTQPVAFTVTRHSKRYNKDFRLIAMTVYIFILKCFVTLCRLLYSSGNDPHISTH